MHTLQCRCVGVCVITFCPVTLQSTAIPLCYVNLPESLVLILFKISYIITGLTGIQNSLITTCDIYCNDYFYYCTILNTHKFNKKC